MAEQLINSQIGSEKQLLFLGKERVIGIRSFLSTPEFGLEPDTYLGIGNNNIHFSPKKEQISSFSINSLLLNKDFFISNVTGLNLANVYVLKDAGDLDSCYSVLSGSFESYQCNYSIGNIPNVTVNFIAYQDAGKIPTGNMTHDQVDDLKFISTGDHRVTGVFIPYGNSIELNIDEFETNRVQSFSIKIGTKKIPIYKMGSKFPIKLDFSAPISVECTFNFEQGDYIPMAQRSASQNKTTKDLNLVIKDYESDYVVTRYNFNNLTLVSESLGDNLGENTIINQVYQGVIYA